MQTERRVAANPQTKPTDLGCESAERLVNFLAAHDTQRPKFRVKKFEFHSVFRIEEHIV